MHIFKIHKGYREIGLNYGLPVIFVDFGIGLNYNSYDTVEKIISMGPTKGGWVVLRNNPLGEAGCGVLVSYLKKIGLRVELEDEGLLGSPNWFFEVDHWIEWWSPNIKFNLGGLRLRQDLLMYKGNDIEKFLTSTDGFQVSRAIIVKDKKLVWELVKDRDVRVYEDVK
jgi:hypothetical protein